MDVQTCLDDEALQRRKHSEASALDHENMSWVKAWALEQGAPESSEWIWFTAPPHAWAGEAGTEGWLLFDRETGRQHGYIETAMS